MSRPSGMTGRLTSRRVNAPSSTVRLRPAASASSVLPVPALPTSVTSRMVSSSRRSSAKALLLVARPDAHHAFARRAERDGSRPCRRRSGRARCVAWRVVAQQHADVGESSSALGRRDRSRRPGRSDRDLRRGPRARRRPSRAARRRPPGSRRSPRPARARRRGCGGSCPSSRRWSACRASRRGPRWRVCRMAWSPEPGFERDRQLGALLRHVDPERAALRDR